MSKCCTSLVSEMDRGINILNETTLDDDVDVNVKDAHVGVTEHHFWHYHFIRTAIIPNGKYDYSPNYQVASQLCTTIILYVFIQP